MSEAAELTPLARGAPVDRERLREQLDARPDDARAWYDLGCEHLAAGEYAGAAKAFDSCRILNPHDLGVQCALAYALGGSGQLEDAGDAFEMIIHRDPGNGWAYLHLGLVRFRLQAVTEAIALWECSANLLDDPSDSLENLAMAYRRLGDEEAEEGCWHRLQKHSADHPAVRHMLAGQGRGPLPVRADDAYMCHLFDRFAPDFDEVLAALDYRVPELLEERLRSVHGSPDRTLEILDAGCGTGLCGERLRPWARRLTGVDISTGMLARASRRDAYDELVESELGRFLGHARNAYDWIVAGDVLCYFGDLSHIVAAAVRRLAPGGHLFLTVERDARSTSSAGPGYRLQSHGRYCHTREHVQAVALAAAGHLDELSPVVLRRESGEPVAGLCALVRRDA